MISLGTITGAVAADTFHTTMHGTVWIAVSGTTVSNIALTWSTSEGGTYIAYNPDAVGAVVLAAKAIYSYSLPGGLYWKLTGDGSTAAITLLIDGPHVVPA